MIIENYCSFRYEFDTILIILQFDFEDIIRQVAKEVHAIVPIVSFKELAKADWRKLPEIIQSGIGRSPDLVICTHLDQVCFALVYLEMKN